VAAAHISTVNCDEMAGDRSRQPGYEIFSIKRRFEYSQSPDPLSSRMPAHSRIKKAYVSKKMFILLILARLA